MIIAGSLVLLVLGGIMELINFIISNKTAKIITIAIIALAVVLIIIISVIKHNKKTKPNKDTVKDDSFFNGDNTNDFGKADDALNELLKYDNEFIAYMNKYTQLQDENAPLQLQIDAVNDILDFLHSHKTYCYSRGDEYKSHYVRFYEGFNIDAPERSNMIVVFSNELNRLKAKKLELEESTNRQNIRDIIFMMAETSISNGGKIGAASVEIIKNIIVCKPDKITDNFIDKYLKENDEFRYLLVFDVFNFLCESNIINRDGTIKLEYEDLEELSHLTPYYLNNTVLNDAINANIAFGAYMSAPANVPVLKTDEVEEKLLSLGVLRKDHTGKLFNKFTITEEQWEEHGKDISKILPLIAELRNTPEWREQDLIDIDYMTGYEFEDYIHDLLLRLGYTDVETTQRSNDFGVDVIAKKDDIKYAIQCKNYANKLGNTPVQEVATGKNYYNCQVGVVVTNNYFTDNAKKLAEKNGILLWDRDKLQGLIESLYK